MADVWVRLPLGALYFRTWESLVFRVPREHEIVGSNPTVLTGASRTDNDMMRWSPCWYGRAAVNRADAGSIPTLVTFDAIPWSSGKDAWMTPRKSAVRFCPGSLKRWSVGVAVARRRGEAEDRVRVPDGPLQRGPACRWGRLTLARSVWWVQLPSGPLENTGSWSNGKTPPWRGGDPSSTLGGSTDIWKVAGYGSPGRFAKPCDLRVMWVQIPCLPL